MNVDLLVSLVSASAFAVSTSRSRTFDGLPLKRQLSFNIIALAARP